MRIAYVLNSTLLHGGATKSFITLINGVRNENISVCVVLPDKNGIYAQIKEMNVPTLVTTFRSNTYPPIKSFTDIIMFLPRLIGRLTANHIAARKLTKWLMKQDVDIIHTNVGVVNIGYIASRKLNIPHIYHIREYGDLDFGMQYFPHKSYFIAQLAKKNSYSIYITKDIQKYHKQDSKQNSKVIYNGIFPEKRQMPRIKKEPFFLFAGRIEPAKGLDFILDAYAEYTNQSDKIIPLYIAGESIRKDYLSLINNKIHDYQIEKHIKFLGLRSDIEQIMQKATAIIIASSFEGFGRCMAEAMFNGCLVIGRNTSGTKEQMDNGVGIVKQEIALRYNTREELSAHLATTSQMEESEMCKYTEKAFSVVNSLYTKESYVKQVTDFYKEILI